MDQVVAPSMAEEVTSTYGYEQLDLTKQQIRLIALHPAADPSDPIRCDIRSFDMERGPHYIALSYTWGPVNPQQTILINGQGLSIRQNLYDFLHRYRNDISNVHYLWIDQICISQAHEGERNHQVRLMSQIYSHSLSTIIWLGEDSREIAQRYEMNRDLHDVCALFRNRYFTRLWVIQEIFLSSHKRLLCGNIWLELDDLVSALQGSGDSRLPPVEFLNSMLHGSHSDTSLIESGQGSLWYCINRFSAYDCEDPRDKVYGLLGLVSEGDKLEVDYNKSTEDIFLEVIMCVGGFSERSADLMLQLSDLMKLHEYRGVHKGFLKELGNQWMTGKLENIEVGFERRRHQAVTDCYNSHHAEQGCCSDRWWFLRYGVKEYRDRSSYNYVGSLVPRDA
jgi:hypothetical protein